MSQNTTTWRTSRRNVTRIEFEGRRRECRALQVESPPEASRTTVYMASNDETGAAWQRVTIVLPDGATVEIRGSDWYSVDVRRRDGSFVGWLASDPDEAPR